MYFLLELSGNKSVLSTQYFSYILLDGTLQLALLSFQSWNSVSNVTPENNKFYQTVGKTEKEIEIEPGVYEITNIEKILKRALKFENLKNPLKPEQKIDLGEEAIIFTEHNTTFKCEIICRYHIEFSKPKNIGRILGFSEKQKAEPFKRCKSKDIIKILTVKTIDIHCSLITNSFLNDNRSQILHKVNVLELPGYKISDSPQNLI